ncbi:MAG: hypothetical protein ACI9C4_000333 [Paraglaciecola sp.]
MVCIKRVVLDVLKPHQPNALDFSQAIARVGADYHVRLIVLEVDEKTESVQVEIRSQAIDFAAVQAAIGDMGASIHSIDEVESQSERDTENAL